MQFKILFKKDLTSLFQQKTVIATLLLPMLMMIAFGALPSIVGTEDPFELTVFNEDQGSNGKNLGINITDTLTDVFENTKNLKLKTVDTYGEFLESDDGIYIPPNFTAIAINTSQANYFNKMSDTNLRSEPIVLGVVGSIIETVVTEELLKPITIPTVSSMRVYDKDDLADGGESKDRGKLAFPLAYMAFLILILSGSAIRITGFSAEKNAGMMGLLLSSIKNRKELVLSKLATGVTYGMATVFSYIIGALIGSSLAGNTSGDNELSTIMFSQELLTPKTIVVLFFLFLMLVFTSMQMMLTAQLVFGKEAGDRIGTTVNFALSFFFYFSLIGDPLQESFVQIMNPFYWSYKIALNLVFNENYLNSLFYFISNLIFSTILLNIKTNAIEKEKIIFD